MISPPLKRARHEIEALRRAQAILRKLVAKFPKSYKNQNYLAYTLLFCLRFGRVSCRPAFRMSRRFTLFALGIAIFLHHASFANPGARKQIPSRAAPRIKKRAPWRSLLPRHVTPIVARASRISGAGVAVVSIDVYTGFVKAAWMERSTGEKLLDGAALYAVRQRRFKPRMVTTVEIPVQFTPKVVFY